MVRVKIFLKIYLNQVTICIFMDDYYNQIAKGYDSLHYDEQVEKLDLVYSYLKQNNLLNNVKTILDVGCGTGISSDYFSKKGFVVKGIDPAKELIANNTNCAKLSDLVVAPAENIPFDESQFDMVISFTAIQNFSDLQKGLDEIKRVGKTIFMLTVLNGVSNIDEIDNCIRKSFTVKSTIVQKDRFYFIF